MKMIYFFKSCIDIEGVFSLAKKKKKETPERSSIITSNPSLPKVEQRSFAKRHLLAAGLIIACTLIAYANTFEVPFHFDDEHAIVLNRVLHIKSLSPQAWIKFLSVKWHGLRKFTNVTFAVNYYMGQLNPFVYHVTNLLIHMGAGLLLYGFLWLTLRLPVFRQSYDSIAFPVSLLSSLLFVVHPIQIQAVTYIVQRYSSLATLCFLLCMVCYVNGRLSSGSRRWVWSGMSLIGGILAFYSKENTLVLPLFIGLYEFLFFQEGRLKIERKTLRLILLGLGLLLFALLLFWGKFFLEAFHHRLSRMTGLWSDRLLTQCRVFVFYLSLLIYPDPSRLNIDHDFPLSRSLLHPPATLPALLFVLGLLGLAFWRVKRNPLLSYSILWFYGNLLIESILPIDMVFEHRLYRSSASAFFLFSLCAMRGINWFRQKRPDFPGATKPYGFETVVILLLILPLMIFTFQRNRVWGSTITLWEDAVRKSPQKPRPHNNLGVEFHKAKETEKAIASLTTSLKLAKDEDEYASPHFSLGLIYAEIGQTEKAIYHLEKYYVIKPEEAKPLNEIGILYLKNRSFEKAISYFRRGIEIDPKEPKFYANLGNAYLQTNRIVEAIPLFQKALSLDPELNDVRIKLAEAYEQSGQIPLAREELRKALSTQSDSSEVYVVLGAALSQGGKGGRGHPDP